MMFDTRTSITIEDFNQMINIDDIEADMYHFLVASHNKGSMESAMKHYETTVKFLRDCGLQLNETKIKMKLKLLGIEI